jgi:hypothetical protein
VQILAEALPVHPYFHGKTIVIKYGGNAMTDDRSTASHVTSSCCWSA